MLSREEKKEIKSILRKLNDSDLESVAFTTTKGLIKPETRNEAITAIVNYSESAYSLLKRRKLKKEYLFHYLKENKIIIPVTADKWMFIKECLKFWNSDTTQVEEINDDCMDREEVSLDKKIVLSSSVKVSLNNSVQINNFSSGSSSTTTFVMPFSRNAQINSVDSTSPFSSTSVTPFTNNGVQRNDFGPTSQSRSNFPSFPQQPSNAQLNNNVLDEMGRKFSEWFYNLINEINVTPNNFIPDHFWPDCKLDVRIQLPNTVIDNSFSNSKDVVTYFIQLMTSEHLFFHPNNYYGTNCFTEVHGLIKIGVSGVVHQGNNCIGLFDQIFGLVRSAGSEDNWKIKYTELILKIKERYKICN